MIWNGTDKIQAARTPNGVYKIERRRIKQFIVYLNDHFLCSYDTMAKCKRFVSQYNKGVVDAHTHSSTQATNVKDNEIV